MHMFHIGISTFQKFDPKNKTFADKYKILLVTYQLTRNFVLLIPDSRLKVRQYYELEFIWIEFKRQMLWYT